MSSLITSVKGIYFIIHIVRVLLRLMTKMVLLHL